MGFVPDAFQPPPGVDHELFRLRPLGVEHNASDHAAWTSSMDHIRATPGFAGREWPRPMTLDENRADLERHAADFADRTGFTYTVLAPQAVTVIGCVYIYPSEDDDHVAAVRSWVRAADAELDPVLYRAVTAWLDDSWPFQRIDYAHRPSPL
jgi:Acetyltransferase (GNAT) domain